MSELINSVRLKNCLKFMLFFFNDTATTEIYTLSLHDALPISARAGATVRVRTPTADRLLGLLSQDGVTASQTTDDTLRSEEHTSELQSRQYLVCRLLLEKK